LPQPGAAPAKNEWGGTNRKKLKSMVIIFVLWHVKCSIIFSTLKAWWTRPAIITRK